MRGAALELVADRRGVEVALHLVDESRAAVELRRGERAVRGPAEGALVEPGDVGGDQLALAAAERVGAAQQHLGELAQRPGGLGPELEPAADPGDSFGRAMCGTASE